MVPPLRVIVSVLEAFVRGLNLIPAPIRNIMVGLGLLAGLLAAGMGAIIGYMGAIVLIRQALITASCW